MTISADRVECQQAYVLHTRPYKDTSCIVDYLTQDYGRISTVAKGVRRAKSKLKIAVQPFVSLEISWQGRSDLKTLTAGESLTIHPFWQGRTLWCGLYLNELLMRMLPSWDAHPRLFAYYRLALDQLNDTQSQEPVLRIFERHLLEELGFGVLYSHTVDQRQIVEDGQYYFDPQQGFFQQLVTEEPARMMSDMTLYQGQYLLAMERDEYSDEMTRRVAKHLMRRSLQSHLGGKPLLSRELFSRKLPQVSKVSMESQS